MPEASIPWFKNSLRYGSRRSSGNAVDVTALAAEDDIEGRENKLFTAGRTGASLAGNDVVDADDRTVRTFGLRHYFGFEFMGKAKPLIYVVAKLFSLILFFCLFFERSSGFIINPFFIGI